MTATVLQLKEPREVSVRRALDDWHRAGSQWADQTMALAFELKAARDEVGGNDRAFGTWLSANGCDDLNPNDRIALIRFAEHSNIAREVLSDTPRKSLQWIWRRQIQPRVASLVTVTKDVPADENHEPSMPETTAPEDPKPEQAAPVHSNHGARINVPEGKTVTEIVLKGIKLLDQGIASAKIPKMIGLGTQTFQCMRDAVLLSQHGDLNPKDAEIVKQAIEQVERTRQYEKAWQQIKPIAERVWGKKGQRGKSDRKRAQQFEDAIRLVTGTCESASEITIPYITNASAEAAIKRLGQAEGALRKLKTRIREAQHD